MTFAVNYVGMQNLLRSGYLLKNTFSDVLKLAQQNKSVNQIFIMKLLEKDEELALIV